MEVIQMCNYRFIVSTFTRSQLGNKDEKNQDTFLVEEDNKKLVACVVDGATALADITQASRSSLSGAWVADVVKDAVKKYFPETTSAEKLLLLVNEEVAKNLKLNDVDPENTSAENLPSASGSVFVFINKTTNSIEIAQLGDAICLLILKDGTTKLAFQSPSITEDIEAIRLALKISKDKNISLKEAFLNKEIANCMVRGRSKENDKSGKGYGAINGKSSASNYLMSRIEQLDEIKTVIIMSDGMIPPQKNFLDQPDWESVSRLIEEKGSKGLYDYTSKLQLSDPNLIKYPRFKNHDDATCVVINITTQ